MTYKLEYIRNDVVVSTYNQHMPAHTLEYEINKTRAVKLRFNG